MAQPLIFQVRSSESGASLSDFIAVRLKVSGRKAKALLDARRVFVNGRRVWMARHELNPGDEIAIGAGVDGRAASRALLRSLPILFQDDDYLILDKPPGITTNGPDSLEALLRSVSANRAFSGAEAVHRLDRDTSGCVMFAKSRKAKELMIPLFASRSIKKVYRAVVKGGLDSGGFVIRKPLEGRDAVTRVRVLDANRRASHVSVEIDTGRTHQIRKHFSAIHHPVMGDKAYSARTDDTGFESKVPRQMLHAFQIGFKHPAHGRRVTCKAPVPGDFLRCLKQCGLR